MLKIIGSALRSSPSSRLVPSHFLGLSSSSVSRSLSSLSSSPSLTSKEVPPLPQGLQPSQSFSSSPLRKGVFSFILDQDHPFNDHPSHQSFLDQDLLPFFNTEEFEPVETQQLTEEERAKLRDRANLLAAQLGTAFLLRAVIKFSGKIDFNFQKNKLSYFAVERLLTSDQRSALNSFCVLAPYHLCMCIPIDMDEYDPTKQTFSIDESRPDEIPSPEELAEFLEKHAINGEGVRLILAERLWDLNEELRTKYFHPAFDNPLDVLSLCEPVPQTLENRMIQTFFPIVSLFRRTTRTLKITMKQGRKLKTTANELFRAWKIKMKEVWN